MGWSRAQAIDYKMGELKMTELRHPAEQELGAKLDIREFHEAGLHQRAADPKESPR